jgi:hypothetical protein
LVATVGNVTVFTLKLVDVTGVQALGFVGNTQVKFDTSRVFPTGVVANGFIGPTFGPGVLVWGLVNDAQDPNWVPVIDG